VRVALAAGALAALACSRGLPAARGPADAATVPSAADAAALPPLPIEAQWIWVPGADAPDTWAAFRRGFVLDQLPPRASARIAVDSKYWLWVNGKLVVREGGLNRGPDRSGTFHDTVDLRPHLVAGRNVIAVLAWYWGRSARNHASSGKGGLLVDVDLGREALRSDGEWRAIKHPSFGPTGAPLPAGLLPGHNVRFDARREPLGWTELGFDDAGWPAAEARGAPPAAPWNQLAPRPVPPWKDFGLRDYLARRERPGDGGATVVEGRLP